MYSRPARARRDRHRLDVVAAVGRRGVHVQVAAEIGAVDQPRQGARSAASNSPRFSRSSGGIQAEAQRFVDVLLARAGDPLLVSSRNSPYSFSLQAALQGAIAQRDVVRLRAGEVLQRRAAAVGRRPAAGRPGIRPGAGRSTSCRRGRGRARPAGSAVKASISDGRRAGGEDVDVAAGVAAPTQAADDVERRAGARASAGRSTSAARDRGASGSRWRPASCWRSSRARRISASFFAPMPFSAQPAVARRLSSASSEAMPSSS